MKTTFIVTLTAAASALLLSLPAAAQEATPDHPSAVVRGAETASRAEVLAATLAARAAGQIVDGERSAVPAVPALALSRAQVQAETVAARRLGLIANGEQTVVISDAQLQTLQSAARAAGSVVLAGAR